MLHPSFCGVSNNKSISILKRVFNQLKTGGIQGLEQVVSLVLIGQKAVAA